MSKERFLQIRRTDDRDKKLKQLERRLKIGTLSKRIDKAMDLAIKFLDMREEKRQQVENLTETWELDEVYE